MQVLCAGAGAVPGLVVGVVLGVVTTPVVGAIAAAAVLVAVAIAVARGAATLTLHLIGGRTVRDGEALALSNLVDGLCATLGVARPELWQVDDAVPNSCAVGSLAGRKVLVVTSGLLELLGLIELEGVVAHELAHIKRHDANVSAVAVATAGQLSRVLGSDRLVHLAVGRGREYGADRAAVLAVRYPPGLRAALDAFEQGPRPAPGSVFTGGRWSATRWLWIDPMVGVRVGDGGPAGRTVLAPVGELDATAARRDALAEW